MLKGERGIPILHRNGAYIAPFGKSEELLRIRGSTHQPVKGQGKSADFARVYPTMSVGCSLKIRSIVLGVPIVRVIVIVHWGLYWVPQKSGNHHLWL